MEHWFDAIIAPEAPAHDAPAPKRPPASAALPCASGLAAPRDARPLSGLALRVALADQKRAEPQRDGWPARWFEHGADPADARRIKNMWGSALAANVRDAIAELCRDLGLQLRRDPASGPHSAVDWLKSRDFLEVAELSGLDREFAERIRARLLGLFKGGDSAALLEMHNTLTMRERAQTHD